MQLVRLDLARDCVAFLQTTQEWPKYGKFVYVQSVDMAVVAPNDRFWHVDLLRLIAFHIEEASKTRCEFTDADVYFGFVEWEDDGTIRIRTTSGPSHQQLPGVVESALLAELH